MKKLLLLIMAMGLLGTMPVFAEHAKTKADQKVIQECAIQAESIQQKIKRVEGEISKGSTKYNADDMKKLEAKLKELNDLLENLGKR